MIHEGIDIAIRVWMSPLEDSELVVKRLGNSRQMLVASPALIDGRNMTPAALSELPALHWGWVQSDYSWRLQGPNSATAHISFQPRIVTDNLSLLCQAAVAGLGVVHCRMSLRVVRWQAVNWSTCCRSGIHRRG